MAERSSVEIDLEILLLKVAIAPAFVGLVSVAARRYGHGPAGWLVALPINTGTILFVLAVTEGTGFAATAAAGSLLGVVSVSAFAIGYARSATRFAWPLCLGAAIAAFVASTAILSQLPSRVPLDLAGAVVALVLVLAFLPRTSAPVRANAGVRWEIPMRMLTAAVLVLVITSAAEGLGARLSGLLTPVPVFTITLVLFTHSREGPTPVFVFLRGLQFGLFSFAAFCTAVAVVLGPYGIGVALAAGLGAFLAAYGLVRLVQSRFLSGRVSGPRPNP